MTFLTISCHKKTNGTKPTTFDDFIFSYSQLNADYSIKFTNSDTIFLQRRFPRPTELFYSVFSSNDSLKLDSFLKKINFKNYDTVYVQKFLEDGGSYKFVVTKDTTTNWTFIYGDNGPKQLYGFGNWLSNLKDKQNFYPIGTTIDFGNLNYILRPKIPPPPVTENSR